MFILNIQIDFSANEINLNLNYLCNREISFTAQIPSDLVFELKKFPLKYNYVGTHLFCIRLNDKMWFLCCTEIVSNPTESDEKKLFLTIFVSDKMNCWISFCEIFIQFLSSKQ